MRIASRALPKEAESKVMLCQSIDTLAMAFLDDELAPEEKRELELHMGDCAGCRLHVEAERAQLSVLRKALAPPPAPDLVKARLAVMLDNADREEHRQERARARSTIGRWLLPGAAMLAAGAAIFAFVMIRPPAAPQTATVAKEVIRQNSRTLPLEVRGASTGPWLRENFSKAIEPPQFRDTKLDITLLGARLTAVNGHNAAQLRYMVTSGDSCSSMLAIAAAGRTPRYGPTTCSRYVRAACSGSMFSADSPATLGTPVGAAPSATPSTSSRFEAGSVLTSRTRLPASARPIAVAHAAEVLPTPPLPVKNRTRVGCWISVDMGFLQQQPDLSVLWPVADRLRRRSIRSMSA
jgi:anti-sigma factor RsiW